MRRAVTALLVIVVAMASAALALSGNGASDGGSDGGSKTAWDEVRQAMEKGLPKTALEKIEPIIEQAKKDKDWDEAVKAVGLKIALEGNIQGNKPEEKIARMEQTIAQSPAEMKPVMHAILAHWYWHYYQQNRWRIMERTPTAVPPGDDVQSWSLERILHEIHDQIQTALQAEEQLKKTPTAEFNELLVEGTMPDAYRPTMYDFLVHEALAFYTSGESFIAQPQNDYELPAAGPIFGPTNDFIEWEPEGGGDSWIVQAIRLYQDLLRFHKDDKDHTAFLAADLDRLHFGYNWTFGDEADARYKAALKKFAKDHREHELASRAYHLWASMLRDEEELAEAHEIATRGKDLHPKSAFGKECHNLIVQIEEKQFRVRAERVWNKPRPIIDVVYKNLTKLHFRIVAADWTEQARRKDEDHRPEWLDYGDRERLLKEEPVKSWSVDLPATPDYKLHPEEVAAPEGLEPGFYYLIASHDAAFGFQDNKVWFTDFWVSDLALVVRQEYGKDELGGLVLHAVTGEPIEGAKVQLWREEHDRYFPSKTTTTNADGLFHVDGLTYQGRYTVRIMHQVHELVSANEFNANRDYRHTSGEQTVFFTDRSLYRPGQTIHFKGITFRFDHQKDTYDVITGRELTVVFADANGEEIARQRHKTNDYGSFNGSFTAPRDRLTGRMQIYVHGFGEPHGITQVNVEEYKRPKFQVELEPPEDAPKLGAEVTLDGVATAYTGAPTDGAKVRWRVVRRVEFPMWWGWYHIWPPVSQSDQEIAHGTAKTDAEGRFSITFTAEPDPAIEKEGEPVFTFAVTADVTGSAGETRSAQRSLRVGYAAIQATLSADNWQTARKPVEVTVKTQTLGGEPQEAQGVVKIRRLDPPEKVHRKGNRAGYYWRQTEKPDPDLSDPENWPLGEVVAEENFTTDADGTAELAFKLKAGAYQAVLESQDRFGQPVRARLVVTVIDPEAEKLALKVPFLLAAPEWTVEPGEIFTAVWGSGYEKARAYIEVEHRGKILQEFWTDADRTQVAIAQEVTEEMRGGFTVRVTMVRENRAYIASRHVDVPWTNKQLTVKWERFVSKLKPGAEETWTAIITGPDGKGEETEKAVAEMVATLYDASLDAFLPHSWMESFQSVFRQDRSKLDSHFANYRKRLDPLWGRWNGGHLAVKITYDVLPKEIVGLLEGYEWFDEGERARPLGEGRSGGFFGGMGMGGMGMGGMGGRPGAAFAFAKDANGLSLERAQQAGPAAPDLSTVAARKDLRETAFFFPHLVSGEDGEVRIEFTMPEALTEWKFMGFAHDPNLRSGFLEGTAVTSKDLMIQPHPPRFVREGDVLEFTVKVTNRSAAPQQGVVRLTFRDARTEDPRTAALGIGDAESEKPFDVPAGQSRSYAWRISVPDGLDFLIYKAVGSTDTGSLSDGEEGYLPVLPRRILVTESIQLPIRGQQTKTFDFEHLLNSKRSETLEHQSLTVEMASNPAWYAVMSLPYLMEYPHQCSEQVFNRLYANSLAAHIANSDPKIERIFELWRGTDALDSPLLKNEDVKSVMIEETPWLRAAQSESEARRNVGLLFEENRLREEFRRAMRQLTQMQYDDGAWPWFPGGPASDFITLYITTGFGRLRHLGVDVDVTPAVKSLNRLDRWINEVYRGISEKDRDENHLSPRIAFYLYGRSFFLQDQPIADEAREAVAYFRAQAKKYWLEVPYRMSQGHIALALDRFGDNETPQAIMKSIQERSVSDDELGMHWRDLERSWWWYRAPIETQALMIEAFAEITGDQQAVDDCQVWLLKQKQTQSWCSTKATADAVYALLLRGGTNRLASDALVEITLGEMTIEPKQVEAGTGYFRERIVGPKVEPSMGHVTVKKSDPGVAWGGVHWQYFEDLSKIPSYDGTPLKLQKSLWLREYTKDGPVLRPLDGSAEVGDELVVRLEMRVDRDMEYVHLKDQRGSGTEPTDVLSKYKFRDGLAYYQSTRDAASHFFIDYLPKGVYVFEYSSDIVHRGRYQSGIATLECLYAPEFNAHSNSVAIEVE